MKSRLLKRLLVGFLAGSMTISALAGCTAKDPAAEAEAQKQAQEHAAEQQRLKEVNQNDYRGAITRVNSIRSNILGVIETFNERNNAITSERPSDFWNSDSYKYLSTNLLNPAAWEQTQYFNELQASWEETYSFTENQFIQYDAEGNGSYTVDGLTIKHPETNKYTLSYSTYLEAPYFDIPNPQGTCNFDCVYDANHDWAQCVRTNTIWGGIPVKDGMLEYVRLSETEFVIQTSTERLYVKYKDGLYDSDGSDGNVSTLYEQQTAEEGVEAQEQPAEAQEQQLTDPLGTKPIEEFYYTMLNGEPRYEYASIEFTEDNQPYYSFLSQPSSSYYSNYKNIDENKNYICVYSPDTDSIFNHMDELGREWVFEDDGRFKQSISYYGGTMVVKNENQLVDMMECTEFLADGTTKNYDEGIYIPPIFVPMTEDEILAKLNDNNLAHIDELFQLSTDGFPFGERVSFENIMENRNMRMLDVDGTKYDIFSDLDGKQYMLDAFRRDLQNNYINSDSGTTGNTYALPAGRYYFVSSIDTDDKGEKIPDNENYYTMLYEYYVQDEYTMRYNVYHVISEETDDSHVMIQNIKPRETTRVQVESMLGYAQKLDKVDVLDDEGFTAYTVSYPDNIAAYRCENGIIYVHYNNDNIVDMVGQYSFVDPQGLDNVYAKIMGDKAAAEEEAEEGSNK